MVTRIVFFLEIADIYTMKESMYIQDEEKKFQTTETSKKPLVVVLVVSIVLILLLNLISTFISY